MKTAAELRKALDVAKGLDLAPVRGAVKQAMAQLEKQVEDMLMNPTNYSKNPVLGAEMPFKAMYNGNYDHFLRLLSAELVPLGYTVTQSHDGGGMYSTYAVRMEEPRKHDADGHKVPMIPDAFFAAHGYHRPTPAKPAQLR